MSVQQMSLVFTNSRAENTDRLVLLSLANHAGGDGGDAYPSIATIAREARCGESTVRLALKRLLVLGEIQEGGESPLKTRSFRMTLPDSPAPPRETAKRAWQQDPPSNPAPPQDLDPLRSCTPAGSSDAPLQDLRRPPQDLGLRGADPAPEPSVEPSLEPSVEPSAARERASTVVKHGGKIVPADGLALAESIVEDFNLQASTGYATRKGDGKATDNLSRVLSALADHPDITSDVARRMIAAQLADPYWGGRPHLGNVFGPGVVERNLENARNPAPAGRPLPTGGRRSSAPRPSAEERAAALEAEAEQMRVAERSAAA
jgi:hypothetical protein